MIRIKRGITVRKKHKKLLKQVRGYKGSRSRRVKTAREALMKSLVYAYRDRRVKKREQRKLWILKINARLKQEGLTYSKFIKALKDNKIELDRKVLTQLASNEPQVFKKIVEKVK